jgi:hypothetical protein
VPHGFLVVGAVTVDEPDPPDRETSPIDASEDGHHLVDPSSVDDEATTVGLAIEPPVREPHEPEVPERDRATTVPRAPPHKLAGLAIQVGNGGLVGGLLHGEGRRRHEEQADTQDKADARSVPLHAIIVHARGHQVKEQAEPFPP